MTVSRIRTWVFKVRASMKMNGGWLDTIGMMVAIFATSYFMQRVVIPRGWPLWADVLTALLTAWVVIVLWCAAPAYREWSRERKALAQERRTTGP